MDRLTINQRTEIVKFYYSSQSYFFEDENDETVTVTGERYRHMIQNFLISELDSLGLVDMWFQQDGATSHITKATI